jgi:hypothetical protein
VGPDEEGAHRGRPKAELTKETPGYGICSRIWVVRRALLSLLSLQMVRMCINKAPGELCKERRNETLVLPIIDIRHSGVPYSFRLSLHFGLLERQPGV